MKKFFFVLVIAFTFLNAQSICIDPGHGGGDPGAVGWGLQEKDINLDVSHRLKRLLEQSGWKVYIVRSNDKTVSLSARTSYANNLKVDRFVSIHCNAFNKSANGTETFAYTQGSSTSFSLRNNVHPKLVRAMGTKDRGTKTANFYVIKHTNMPAILCELAFIDEKNDSAKLGDAYYRQKAAEAIRSGIVSTLTALDEETKSPNSYIAPKWSPDGNALLVTGPGYKGINILDLAQSKITNIYSGSSYKSAWTSENTVITFEDQPQIITMDGHIRNSFVREENTSCKIENGQLVISHHGLHHIISEDDNTIYNAVMSPNGQLVAYESFNGLHIATVNGEKVANVGTGNNPSWLSDSSKIVFDYVQDNGHEITQGDICIFDLSTNERQNITPDVSLITQRPSVSADGEKIAFDAEGKIYIADLKTNSIENIIQLTK